MKYYHLIYNSSQRTQNGSTGLGVRTYTKGMPNEYITILKDNGFFSYSSGSLVQPSPKALLEDGNIIRKYPATYRFASFFVSEGKTIYVLSRTVTVGFDYPYYVKFTAARVDNFVVDAYIFEEFPSMEAFEMLYESPAPDSNGFLPRNVVPSPENEEMKVLSINEMPLFEPEEKPFKCTELHPVSDLSFELLFASLEAKRKNLPLLVKCAPEQAPSLMSDLLRLLPEASRKNAFFYTNYQLEGLKEGFNFFFVNEYYKYDYESYGQFYVFDTTQNSKIQTKEADTYRQELIKLFNEGRTEEYQRLISWILGPIYAEIKDKDDNTKKVLFCYTLDSKNFNMNDVFRDNEEVWSTLKAYFAKDKANQQLFDKNFTLYLESDKITGEKFIKLLKITDKIVDFGFNVNAVIANSKKVISSKIFETPDTFKGAIDAIGIEKLKRYIDLDVLNNNLSNRLSDGKANGDQIIQLLKETENFIACGFDVSAVVTNSKKVVSEKVLETPDIFKKAIDSIGIEKLEKYLDTDILKKHSDFLKSTELKKDWPKVYKYFLSKDEQNDHIGIMLMMMEISLPEKESNEVIKGFGLDDFKLCDNYIELVKRKPSEIDISFKRINDILVSAEQNRRPLPDPNLSRKIDETIIAPLMKDEEHQNGVDSCHELLQLLSGKFTAENGNALFERAIKIGTSQTAKIMYSATGWQFINNDNAPKFVKEVMTNVKPDGNEFLHKIEAHPCKMQLLEAYFKITGDNKKAIDKLIKTGALNLSDEEYSALKGNLFANNGGNDEKDIISMILGNKIYLISAIAIVVLLIVGILLALLLRTSSVEAKFNTTPPEKDGKITIHKGDTITFTNASNNADSLVWTFENGEPEKSSKDTVKVSFTKSGKALLIAYGKDKNLTDTAKVSISIIDKISVVLDTAKIINIDGKDMKNITIINEADSTIRSKALNTEHDHDTINAKQFGKGTYKVKIETEYEEVEEKITVN